MKYKSILLKLSGESLAGANKAGIDPEQLASYAKQIKKISEKGVEIAIVIGGGNIFRGLKASAAGFDRVSGDSMGMLATVINSIALCARLEEEGCSSKLLTATKMAPIGELYRAKKAKKFMSKGKVVIIAGGTGNPFFTTDTASALRACELQVDVMLKGTRVDGIYDSDPEKNPDAKKFENISYDEIYKRGLKVMDMTATTMCKENDVKIAVFDMDTEGNLGKVVAGEAIGTVVS
ncbi:uridylate kinase [Balneicella halophila]|uniref:Uridylate kinase n=2 Tax=Balneicella halophila TaxID=1537566 RepID=A0A7L4URC3_BALHA|nr:uridylate kinase [Balneicella halophila]